MKIERFEAPTMQEALEKVKASLGSEAVIIATHTQKRPGLFAGSTVYVTAALDNGVRMPSGHEFAKAMHARLARAESESASLARGIVPGSTIHVVAGDDDDEPNGSVRANASAGAGAGAGAGDESEMGVSKDASCVNDEVAWLPTGRGRSAQQARESNHTQGLGQGQQRTRERTADPVERPPDHTSLVRALASADVELPFAAQMAELALGLCSEEERLDDSGEIDGPVGRALRRVVAQALLIDGTAPQSSGQEPVVRVLVGPTGVGKTTTLAKLAARAKFIEGRKIGLVSLDDFRLGATAQLREVARLIECPFVAAQGESGWNEALRTMQALDEIWVDTAGRNPADVQQVPSLVALLSKSDLPVYVTLTLSAACRQAEVRQALQRFAPLRPGRLIFTKLDEACVTGGLLNASLCSGIPLAHITFGQRIPEDIAVPSPAALARRLVQEALDFTGSVGLGGGDPWEATA